MWRAKIILATAEGCGTAEIMRRASIAHRSRSKGRLGFECRNLLQCLSGHFATY
jgi:hypothetical protein